jgi:hypothetical protein
LLLSQASLPVVELALISTRENSIAQEQKIDNTLPTLYYKRLNINASLVLVLIQEKQINRLSWDRRLITLLDGIHCVLHSMAAAEAKAADRFSHKKVMQKGPEDLLLTKSSRRNSM